MVPNNDGELRGHGSMTGVAYAECAARQSSKEPCGNSPIQRNRLSTHFHILVSNLH